MLLHICCVLLLAALASAAPMMDGNFVDGYFIDPEHTDKRTARAGNVRVPRLQHAGTTLRAEYSDEDLNRPTVVDLSGDIDRFQRQVEDQVEQLDDEQEVPMKVSFWKRLWGKIKIKAKTLYQKCSKVIERDLFVPDDAASGQTRNLVKGW